METAVDKLEAMFQKAEADMEYIDKRLRQDFLSNAPEHCSPEENPVKLLENLSAVKARHAALCAQVEEMAAEQKQSMDAIKAHLTTTVQLVGQLQQSTNLEVLPLNESEKEAVEFFGLEINLNSPESSTSTEPLTQEQPQSSNESDVTELSEAALAAVPQNVRVGIKLPELNAFYRRLHEHLSAEENSSLSIQQMKQLKMKGSDAKLKTLQHLSLIEFDKKGHVRLLV